MIENFLNVLITIFLFAVFSVLHTILASNGVKKYLAGKFEKLIAFYRLFYVLISFLSLYVIFILIPIDHTIIYDLPYPFDFLILIPQFAALAGILFTVKYFSTGEFVGLNQIIRWKNKNYNPGDLDEELTLRIGGPYKYCRHPAYFYSILFLAFRPEMNLTYATFLLCVIAYFYIGSFYEEKKLVEKFGVQYERYRQTVPRIVPYKLYLFRRYKKEVD
jgi:methanethiol S-methyltransferase